MYHTTLAFGFSDVGGGEMIIVGIIALLLFGKNLPTVSRNVGRAIAEFKKTLSAASSEIKREMDAAAAEVEASTKDIKNDNTLDEVKSSIKNAFSDDTGGSSGSAYSAPASLPSDIPSSEPERPKIMAPSISDAAALDALPRNIPAPSKVPPPIA